MYHQDNSDDENMMFSQKQRVITHIPIEMDVLF